MFFVRHEERLTNYEMQNQGKRPSTCFTLFRGKKLKSRQYTENKIPGIEFALSFMQLKGYLIFVVYPL